MKRSDLVIDLPAMVESMAYVPDEVLFGRLPISRTEFVRPPETHRTIVRSDYLKFHIVVSPTS